MKSIDARFSIGGREVGDNCPTFIVAELGANHSGDKSKLIELVNLAADCGVDAIKLQTYTSKDLVSDPDRLVRHGPPGQERLESIGKLFDRLAVPLSWHEDIFTHAKQRGLLAFSTPFSIETAQALGDMGVPAFKVAASDLVYLPMLSAAAAFGRPIIISAGKCHLSEVTASVEHLRKVGVRDLAVLHCIAQYPAPANEMRLPTISLLKQMFPHAVIGLSDHSIGIGAALASVVLGARLIEKHFTLSKNAGGPDDWFSADPAEMALLIREVRAVEAGLVGVREGVLPCEMQERETSVRSLVTNREITAGTSIQESDLSMLRPGTGISPLDMYKIVGAMPARTIPVGTVLTWDHFRRVQE